MARRSSRDDTPPLATTGRAYYGDHLAGSVTASEFSQVDSASGEVANTLAQPLVKHLQRQGTQYDLLVDNVGSLELYWNAHDYLKTDGLYINIAGTATLSHVLNVLKVSYLPAWLGGGQRAAMFLRRKSNEADFAQIAKWIAEGKLRPVIEKVYALDEAAEAFARLKTGRSKGKLVIKVADE